MKRKLLFSIVLCLFAGLTVFNIGLAHRPDYTDTTLDLISVMVKAFDEGEGHTVTADCTDYDEATQGHLWYDGEEKPGDNWVRGRNCLAPGCKYMWRSIVLVPSGKCTFKVGEVPV